MLQEVAKIKFNNMLLYKTRFSLTQCARIVRLTVFIIISFFLLSFFLHSGRFASHYNYIKHSEIEDELEPLPSVAAMAKQSHKVLCSHMKYMHETNIQYPNLSVSDLDLERMAVTLGINQGGAWKPSHCLSKYQIAIIIPYRNRSSQLQIFLSHMHPFLQKQMLDYRIFVIEQSMEGSFNRAKLLNVGFMEGLKILPYHCFIFHDVDLIPLKLTNIYACTHQPRHLSSNLDTFRYTLPYQELFGGAIAILREQFELVNGFSNLFFGWGGEDDDFHGRIINKGLSICRFPPNVAMYTMLLHAKEPPSESRFQILGSGRDRFQTDGINSLHYTVLKREYYTLYTWLLVDVMPGNIK